MNLKSRLFSFFKRVNRRLFGRNLGAIPLARPLHRAFFNLLRPRGIVATKVFGRPFLVNAEDKGEGRDILLHGVYSPFETKMLRSLIKPNMRAVDIGAHIGYFTVMMADLAGEGGRVFAFEPEPKNFELLSKNIALNRFSNVSLHNLALGDKSGERELFTDNFNLGNPSFARKNIPRESTGEGIDVSVKTLDEILPAGEQIDFIKIDVQGAEALALAGAKQTLGRVKAMIVEFWPYGLRNVGSDPLNFLQGLTEQGFSLYVISEAKKEFKKKTPEELLNVANNRPEGKGWADIICYKGNLA